MHTECDRFCFISSHMITFDVSNVIMLPEMLTLLALNSFFRSFVVCSHNVSLHSKVIKIKANNFHVLSSQSCHPMNICIRIYLIFFFRDSSVNLTKYTYFRSGKKYAQPNSNIHYDKYEITISVKTLDKGEIGNGSNH